MSYQLTRAVKCSDFHQNDIVTFRSPECYGLASAVVRRPLTSSQELLGQPWPNLVCSICRARRQEMVNMPPYPSRGEVKSVKLMNSKFHDPWGRASCAKVWPYKFYSENTLFLLNSKTQIRQTEDIVMLSLEQFTKIVNFMTTRAEILVLGRGQISHEFSSLQA